MLKHCPNCGQNLEAYQSVAAGNAPAAGSAIARAHPEHVATGYDPIATWKRIKAKAMPRLNNPMDKREVVAEVIRASAPRLAAADHWERPAESIVHVYFDRNIVPVGGTLAQALSLEGRVTPTMSDPKYLATLGYSVEDGKIRMDEQDNPVGPAYGALQYWGGEKQHRRWHLAEPIELNASRSGNPLFMDECMVAFGAKWIDADKFADSMGWLYNLLALGPNDSGVIALPLVMEVAWR